MPTLDDTDVPATDAAEAAMPATVTPPLPSRRRFFALGASAVAVAGAQVLHAQPGRTRGKPLPKQPPVGTNPDPSASWQDPVLRLVRRITMGLERDEITLARQLGYAGYLEYQLNADAIDDSAVETEVATKMPLLSQDTPQLRTADFNLMYNQLSDAALYRAAFSKRQLKERMVEFWTDHFNILYDKVSHYKLVDDRVVIRQHAMGKFPDMLRASAHSPAMLLYLDQNTSRKPTPNQNYAREIMELHTLGVEGDPYSQEDVAQLSRIFTGWSFNGTTGVFTFNKNNHDFTAKTFLNTAFPAMPSNAPAATMQAEGELAITMLLEQPATARFIARKMAAWLLAYEPPAAVVDATAAVFTATGGDIKAMIRTILTGKNLMASPAKFKRPFHLAASSLRGLAAEVTDIRPARQRLSTMSMDPFYWEQPDGYPDRVSWWSGLATQRWNWGTYIANRNSTANVVVNVTTKFRAPVNSPDGVLDQINQRMFGGEMPSSLRASLSTYLRAGTFNDTRVRETLALATSSQEFQWY